MISAVSPGGGISFRPGIVPVLSARGGRENAPEPCGSRPLLLSVYDPSSLFCSARLKGTAVGSREPRTGSVASLLCRDSAIQHFLVRWARLESLLSLSFIFCVKPLGGTFPSGRNGRLPNRRPVISGTLKHPLLMQLVSDLSALPSLVVGSLLPPGPEFPLTTLPWVLMLALQRRVLCCPRTGPCVSERLQGQGRGDFVPRSGSCREDYERFRFRQRPMFIENPQAQVPSLKHEHTARTTRCVRKASNRKDQNEKKQEGYRLSIKWNRLLPFFFIERTRESP